MSDMIEYDVSISPSPAEVDLTVATSGTAVNVTVASVPDIDFSLTPTGNIIQKILSAIAWPIAAIIAADSKGKPRDELQGKTFKIGSIPDYPTSYVVISASAVTLGSATVGGTAMTKATATLSARVPATTA